MLIRLALPATGFDSAGGILRAGEAAAVAEASRLLEDVQRQCSATLAAAEAEARALREAAARHAREEVERGFQQGQAQAAEAWHARHAELLQHHEARTREAERELAGVVMLAVRKIVDTLPPQALYARSLAGVQHQMRGAGAVTLCVSAADVPAAEAAAAQWREAGARPFELEVRADETLAPGSCVFRSSLGTLDTSLGVQLAGLQGALDRAVGRALNAAQEPR